MAGPDVSVVIPTRGRETRLAFALEALAGQTLAPERFEVIVVRAPGGDGPLAGAPDGLRVRFVTAEVASRPGQRNVGWRLAAGRLVAFTDDDCRPGPGWLEGLLATARNGAFVQGPTAPDPDEAHLLHGLARSVRVEGPSPWFETSNVAYPRVLLDELGGFDEAYERSGEDTDLGLRAIEAGAEPVWAADAAVRHAVVSQPIQAAVREGWTRWESTPLLYRRHPGHRRHLWGGVFFNRTHAAVCGVALAALLARRRRPLAAAVAATPFVLDSIDTANTGPRGLLRQAIHLPARFAREAAQTAGVLRGAVRHRTPVI